MEFNRVDISFMFCTLLCKNGVSFFCRDSVVRVSTEEKHAVSRRDELYEAQVRKSASESEASDVEDSERKKRPADATSGLDVSEEKGQGNNGEPAPKSSKDTKQKEEESRKPKMPKLDVPSTSGTTTVLTAKVESPVIKSPKEVSYAQTT